MESGDRCPLGPEADPVETARTAKVRTEAQGLGNAGARERPPNALGALSVSTVTQHGEPVGTRSAGDLLRNVLEAPGRNGELTRKRLQEIERLVRDALRALSEPRPP